MVVFLGLVACDARHGRRRDGLGAMTAWRDNRIRVFDPASGHGGTEHFEDQSRCSMSQRSQASSGSVWTAGLAAPVTPPTPCTVPF